MVADVTRDQHYLNNDSAGSISAAVTSQRVTNKVNGGQSE